MNRRLANAILLAFLLWTIMFSPWTTANINLWGCMTTSAILLSGMAFWYCRRDGVLHPIVESVRTLNIREWLINIALGIGLTVVLWGVFWVVNMLSKQFFPNSAYIQGNTIYGMKDGINVRFLPLVFLLIIGPSEEFFWRGYVQRTFQTYYEGSSPIKGDKSGTLMAFVVATLIYVGIHIASLNFMLIMVALVCGIVWGGLYYFAPKYYPAIVLSHALWDTAMFIWFPI